MKKTVLIIDDDAQMRELLEDRISSLGFDCDSAACQTSATTLLQKRQYDLILLDQELPVKKGKPTNKQVGRNLLDHIRLDANNESTPVIVVTAHDGDNSCVVSDLMLNGANYFIHKPQLAILEEKIKAVFEKQKRNAKKGRADMEAKEVGLKPYPGGRLTFRDSGVYLDDIRICSATTQIGRILRELCKTNARGKRRAQSCKELAKALNLERGDQAIVEAVSPFRKLVIERLREAGFSADMDTVINRCRGGYELASGIEAEADHFTSDSADPPDTTPDERQKWFLDQLKLGRKLTRAQFEEQFDMSVSTSKRDLRMLGGTIEFIGAGKAGYYRTKEKTAHTSKLAQ